MASGDYEPEQTAWLKECLSPGSVFADVGASFGHYTGLASTIVGRRGHVFAFEPSPIASSVIASTIKDNRLRNVTLTVAAVGDKNGSERIFMPVNDAVHPSAFFSDAAFEPLVVPLIRLDTFEAMSGCTLDAVKIDVEGYEPNVIRGLQQMAARGAIRNLIIEFNSGWLRRNGTTPQDLFDLIVSLGFAVHRKTELAQHPERDGTPYQLRTCGSSGAITDDVKTNRLRVRH